MTRPLGHFEIRVRDPARLREFYASLFGWKIDANNPMKYGVVKTGSAPGGGIDGGIYQAEAGMQAASAAAAAARVGVLAQRPHVCIGSSAAWTSAAATAAEAMAAAMGVLARSVARTPCVS